MRGLTAPYGTKKEKYSAMNTNKRFLTVVSCCGMILAGAAIAGTQMPAATVVTDTRTAEETAADSIARLDSIRNALTASLNQKATDLYKNLKFIQYDGITEQELYPQVMATYLATLEALGAPRVTEEDIVRHRGVLIDVAPLLLKGAIYYSGNQNQKDFTQFATAYVDTRLNPMMATVNFGTAADPVYPTLIYAAASGAYNTGDFKRAADYLEAYLRTGDDSRRESAYTFYGQACLKSEQAERCTDALLRGVEQYPANYNLMMLALQCCLDADETGKMQPVLDKAIPLRPNDEQLLNIQGRIYEEQGNYADALGYYQRLYDLKPNSLSVNQHLALCYYNLGADYYNKSIMESDEKLNKKYMRQSNAYFTTAADNLSRIVENDPSNGKYLMALAKTYGCLGNKEKLDEVNNHLAALGMATVRMNEMPDAITVGGQSIGKSSTSALNEVVIPDFQTFAAKYVSDKLNEWATIREFEKMEDFNKRVNQETVLAQHKSLSKEAENNYLKKYASKFRISDMKLMPYDAENECYKIQSSLGDFVLNVPLKNNEAEIFKKQWETAQVRDPRYFIKDNRVAIASISIVTSAGKTYKYSSDMAANYDYTPVSVDFAGILGESASRPQSIAATKTSTQSAARVIRAKSDVDENIPVTSYVAANTLALVIANENYSQVSGVESALQDGETFAEYCRKTLGIPEKQVLYYPDITLGGMISAVDKVKRLAGALGNNVDLIVYYAGHGFPDEGTKDAYLLPTDGNGVATASAYSLKKFYNDLAASGADNVMVFLDACFSGAARSSTDEMLAKARGVALKPRQASPEGNMFVLSATTDQQTAMPYREKHHGLFTYFLLKKIKESNGKVSLRELSDYVTKNVQQTSVPVNGKAQTPKATVSGRLAQSWGEKKLRP